MAYSVSNVSFLRCPSQHSQLTFILTNRTIRHSQSLFAYPTFTKFLLTCVVRCQQQQQALQEPLAKLPQPPKPAAAVVKDFYSAINRRNLDDVQEFIGENCVYEDLVFPQPFRGKKAILEFFEKFTKAVGPDLLFVIDDITENDLCAVGVTWHLEWRGKPFPFSKGCSFYRCDVSDGKRFIIYGRDSVEPATKPGSVALVAIRAVSLVLERFPWLADGFK